MKLARISVVVLALAMAGGASAHELSIAVVRVRAIASDGTVKLGTGVVIEPGRVATACHVTRGASRVELARDARRWDVDAQHGSQHHDLCILRSHGIDVPPVHARRPHELRLGEKVVAVGFEGWDRPILMPGEVAGLYLYDGGEVIRTSTTFDFGSSGGALFDTTGRLVGILAFRARTGDSLRFALPVKWLEAGGGVEASFRALNATDQLRAFWEMAKAERPAFLGAALDEAVRHARR